MEAQMSRTAKTRQPTATRSRDTSRLGVCCSSCGSLARSWWWWWWRWWWSEKSPEYQADMASERAGTRPKERPLARMGANVPAADARREGGTRGPPTSTLGPVRHRTACVRGRRDRLALTKNSSAAQSAHHRHCASQKTSHDSRCRVWSRDADAGAARPF